MALNTTTTGLKLDEANTVAGPCVSLPLKHGYAQDDNDERTG